MIEGLARIAVEVDVASEFRYRKPLITPEHLMVVITQSGETADTLAAQREARVSAQRPSRYAMLWQYLCERGNAVFYTHSGPE